MRDDVQSPPRVIATQRLPAVVAQLGSPGCADLPADPAREELGLVQPHSMCMCPKGTDDPRKLSLCVFEPYALFATETTPLIRKIRAG